MATTIRMPEVLANVTEAAVQKWLVAPGDAVAASYRALVQRYRWRG